MARRGGGRGKGQAGGRPRTANPGSKPTRPPAPGGTASGTAVPRSPEPDAAGPVLRGGGGSGRTGTMAQLTTWPRPALYTVGALSLAAALGWGVAIERNARVTAERQAVAATDARARSLEQRAGTAEADLARERQASGDLDAVNQRLVSARGELDRPRPGHGSCRASWKRPSAVEVWIRPDGQCPTWSQARPAALLRRGRLPRATRPPRSDTVRQIKCRFFTDQASRVAGPTIPYYMRSTPGACRGRTQCYIGARYSPPPQ